MTGSSSTASSDGGYSLMAYIKDIPTLKGNNYIEWKKKINLTFILAEVDWVVTTPCPKEPEAPVRETNKTNAAWQNRERNFAPVKMSFDLEHRKWVTTNKKCLALIKNTIEPAIVGSISDYDTVTEYLERIKSQFTGSSKTYATQLIKQLVTERYSGGGGGIREHILRMSNLASKLKPMDLALNDEFLLHLIFASLPKEFDTFVVNYNIQPEKWDLEKLIAMCVLEEERIKVSQGGTINYLKDNKKKNYNNSSSSKSPGKGPMQQSPNKQFPVDKDQCLHCKGRGHYKQNCPDFLKMIMKKKEDEMMRGSMVAREIDLEEKQVYAPTPMVWEPFFELPAAATPTTQDVVVPAPVVIPPMAITNEDEEPMVQNPTEPIATHEGEQQQPQTENVSNVEALRRSQRVRRSAISDDYEIYNTEEFHMEAVNFIAGLHDELFLHYPPHPHGTPHTHLMHILNPSLPAYK
ncbi:uncharacterized protein [Miscanthus floridulus]|uniref:uncharacterized protein n=1 Tax=Miscanthus floridulus TaxID=154761 RepID=UPI00345A9D5D